MTRRTNPCRRKVLGKRRFTPAATHCRCERSTYLYRGIYCREHHDDPRNRESIAAMSLE